VIAGKVGKITSTDITVRRRKWIPNSYFTVTAFSAEGYPVTSGSFMEETPAKIEATRLFSTEILDKRRRCRRFDILDSRRGKCCPR
jgi:hypothetical protein